MFGRTFYWFYQGTSVIKVVQFPGIFLSLVLIRHTKLWHAISHWSNEKQDGRFGELVNNTTGITVIRGSNNSGSSDYIEGYFWGEANPNFTVHKAELSGNFFYFMKYCATNWKMPNKVYAPQEVAKNTDADIFHYSWSELNCGGKFAWNDLRRVIKDDTVWLLFVLIKAGKDDWPDFLLVNSDLGFIRMS